MNQTETKIEIKNEIKKESIIKRLARNKKAQFITVAIIVIITVALGVILKQLNSRVYTDQADIEAPTITLAPATSGVLEKILVAAGDHVAANTPVAQIGTQIIQTKVAGIITHVKNSIGQIANPGDAIVTMIDPAALRAVAHLDEDKGLSDIRIGQHATFTVDAFGSKQYEGIVDEISPTAREGDIVFNISGQRQVQEFDIKIRFDTTLYQELGNGMSAKIYIYKAL